MSTLARFMLPARLFLIGLLGLCIACLACACASTPGDSSATVPDTATAPSPSITTTATARGATPSPTRRPSATATATNSPTVTPILPTRTATATPVPTASATAPATPSMTATLTPTAVSATLAPTFTATSTTKATEPVASAQPAASAQPTAQTATAQIAIVAFGPKQKPEFVELRNAGAASQDLTGWRLHSVTGDQWFDFPSGFVLAPGASVRVLSGPGATHNPPETLLWTDKYIWNNDGDPAELYAADGRLVDSGS